MKMICRDLPEEFDTIQLFVFSDLHVGSAGFDSALFDKCRTWVLDKPNRYIILNGDLMDMVMKNSKGNSYQATKSPQEQFEWCQRELTPMKDRILAITRGNHENRPLDGSNMDPIWHLANKWELLDLYHPDGAYVKITFGKKPNGKRQCYTIYATHGAGGATTTGGKANAMAKPSLGIIADVYLTAHTHWQAAFRESVWLPDLQNKKLMQVSQLYVNSSSLLDWGGYAQAKLYKPGAKGSPHITFYSDPKKIEVTL